MDDQSVLQQGLIYLAAAVISVPIAKKLGLGSVLGYLIAGVLIGPFVFQLVGGDQEQILHFAEFGVVMMLFLVGLELQPTRLWEMRGSILGLGGGQVIATTAVLAGIAMLMGLDSRESFAVGMILALSSTAIVLQSLVERGLLKTSAGQNSFSVLLFQDIAVIPILAILPLLGGGLTGDVEGAHGASSGGIAQALMLVGVIAALVIGGHYLMPPLLRFVAQAKLREVFTAAALLLVVALAYIMQLINVSPALGAFLGGVLLAESEYRHELESNIEPFKGLLLGLFFITVGATMDLGLFASLWHVISALVIGLMLVKFAVLFALGRLFKMQVVNNVLFAAAMCQAGEFAFVLFASARVFGVLELALIDLLTLVVAISMVLTPLVMIAYARFALVWSKKFAARNEPAQAIEPQKNPVIVAGYGRFGQIVGRFLHSNGYDVTLLDHDAGQIELVRKFGFKVFYGDATRMDLLHTAGAADARLLVVAINDRRQVLRLVEDAQKHFPNLKIIARAYDRTHAYELIERGVHAFRRETFGSALELGVDALRIMGHRAFQAQRSAQMFRRHDEDTLLELYGVWHDDEEKYVLQSRERRAQLEKLMRADHRDGPNAKDGAWERPGA